ncbi:MAG: UbiA family prenyltransferase [Candidatus Diapherotrites archaeon]
MSRHYDFLHLIVPEYIPMAITTALVGAVSTTNAFPGFEFIIVAIVLTLIVAAFNAFNAIADREIDQINKPERPLPSKKISNHEALLFAITAYSIALLLSLLINPTFFAIIFIAVLVTTAYSYPGIDLKRKFGIGNFTVTVFYAILCSLAGWALYPNEPIPIPIISFLFLIGLSLSISKDFMDMPGDAFHQANTLPVKFGKNPSVGIIFIFLVISYLVLLMIIIMGLLSQQYYFLFIFFPLMLFNVNRFRIKSNSDDHNHVFIKTVLLIIVLEISIILLEVFV